MKFEVQNKVLLKLLAPSIIRGCSMPDVSPVSQKKKRGGDQAKMTKNLHPEL